MNEIPSSGRPYVIRGGTVMSMDPVVGDFETADVLVDGERIVAVGTGVDVPAGADVIDARGRVVMPGFVDTHHHLFETALRSYLPNGLLINDGSGSPSADPSYMEHIIGRFAPAYRPQDVHINMLYGRLSQLDAGVTTVLDTSQIHHTPEHSDAAVQALTDARARSVAGYWAGDGRADSRFPQDARRLRDRYFAGDGLLTMAMGGEIAGGLDAYAPVWTLARELDVPIAAHALGFMMDPIMRGLARGDGGIGLGPDVLFIHMVHVSDPVWHAVRDAGVRVSLAVPIEMTMRHGTPPLLTVQALGMEPSLSSDVETTMAADPFTLMRATLTLQRMQVNEQVFAQPGRSPEKFWPAPAPGTPQLLLDRDVLRFATLNGAEHLGLGHRTGSLTPGKEADIVILDATALNVAPMNSAPGAVVTLMDRTNVETVIVGGTIRKWRGRLLDADLDRLRGELEDSRDHLFRAAGITRNLFA
ncbi:cytosine/adenosine deaminase-related metal-dependent hydrolase [Catenuloplanes nepalensis]|uniref:Cytosine/adenosine deaminase-related metal-dependent hydrolase n=1 Tax=Catenuloplanes nepalensis TaxID=587533 RepID=A0ABT9MPC4_9ACTN|nr:amidohydrolase family protein [Catenuloplanes nepalensis]MDP9793283.1 cytosine/adenosine deaminase-related metal-dependent hydrolase [Catenuloplanes nepalensis]